jgi:hypothetical protein
MKNTKDMFLVKVDVGNQENKNPKILRVLMGAEYIKIDFGYIAPWIYDHGGWINIAPNAYIQVQGSKKKYALKEAINIPLAPQQFEFESTEDWRVFSLLFEPIPAKDCIIDIIEKEEPNSDNFNFYNIKLEDVSVMQLFKVSKELKQITI